MFQNRNKRKQWFQRKPENKEEKEEKEVELKTNTIIKTPKIESKNARLSEILDEGLLNEQESKPVNEPNTSIIDTGSFSTVYKVTDEKNFIYAKKVCDLTILDYETYITDSSIREIAALSKLSGNFVPELYSINYSLNKVNINMEYIPHNLITFSKTMSYIERIRLVPNILYQLISCVYNMEMNGFYNFDIKPENILVNNKKEIKLCDFGLSKFFFKFANKESCNSTVIYLAPEDTTINYSPNSMLWKIAFSVIVFLLKDCYYIPEILLSNVTDFDINKYTTEYDIIRGIHRELKKLEYIKLQNTPLSDLKTYLGDFGISIFNLLEKMLYVDTTHRISIKEAYNLPVFARFKKIYPAVLPKYKNSLYVKCWLKKQPNLDYNMRSNLISYLCAISQPIRSIGVVPLAMILCDKYLDVKKNISNYTEYTIIGICCLSIANSLCYYNTPSIKDYVNCQCSDDDFIEKLKDVITSLRGDLYYNTFLDDVDIIENEENIFFNQLFYIKINNTLSNVIPPYNNKKLLKYYNTM